MQRVYLVGNNLLAGEALQQVLNKRGYEAFFGSIEIAFGEKHLFKINPDILIWQEGPIEIREKSLFDLFETHKISFRSIFILSEKTFYMLGLGLTKGIHGYVHNKGGIKDLETCITSVKRGSIFISPLFTEHSQDSTKRGRKNFDFEDVYLTNQEETILKLISNKKTSKEIGSILNISTKTVQNHRQNICNKLGLRGRGSLYEFSKAFFE